MDTGGYNAIVRAENGIGKTTLYDAWLWLLFGKDSEGRADFGIRPLDENNQAIKGLVVMVEAELEIDGAVHILRKEQHEKVVKDQIKGYETRCHIDEVPVKVWEYQDYISNLCPEEMFKMFTDLAYFNGKMHWMKRRKILLDIAGILPRPAGFENLLSKLNGRQMDDYKKVLIDRKKSCEKERLEINPRIDELQRGLDDYAQSGKDEKELKKNRESLQKDIDDIDVRRNDLFVSEKARQRTIERINDLTIERIHREGELRNDTSGQKALLDEKAKLEREYADKIQNLANIQLLIQQIKSAIESSQIQIESSQRTLENARNEIKQADSPNCPTCGQKWPKDKTKPGLADIKKYANKVKVALDDCLKRKADLEDEHTRFVADEKAKTKEVKTSEIQKSNRIAEIDKALKNRPKVDPITDERWRKITADIESLKNKLGEPITDQLNKIEAEKRLLENDLNKINESLAQADNIAKSKARIAELEAREKELAQLIAYCEKELDEIQQYKMQESKMVEAAVNGKFKHVTFKLFDYYLNGEINDQVCEAIYQGVSYPDMSSGQKIFCGIDIVNVLSDHYGVTIPLFIDHSESMTMPIEAETQTIQLVAAKGIRKLQVEVQKEKVTV